MKAWIIVEKCYDGILAYSHGMSTSVKRIFVPEMHLSVTIHQGAFYVATNYKMGPDCRKISELEIPDRLVQEAIELAEKQSSLMGEFGKLLATTR
jgi:hypothetical protein